MRMLPMILCCAPLVNAVIVDRIAIAVGTRVITDSAIDLRLRLTAFENGDKPDTSPTARKQAADRLIDERLVEREMDLGHYPRLTDAERKPLVENFSKMIYKGDMAALDRTLAAYGLTETDLQDDLARQSDLLSFLNVRFRPAVQISDGEVRSFFDKTVRPLQPNAALNDFRNQIEQRLAGERANNEMEAWLKDQRKSTRIEYLEKDLAP